MRQQLTPTYAADVPTAIAEANTRALAAVDAAESASRDARDAQAVANRAPAEDAAADFAVLRDGKKLPEPTAPVKRAAADTAGRKATACRRAAKAALDELRGAIVASQREWIDAQHGAVDAAEQRVSGLTDQLAEALDDLGRQTGLLDSIYMYGDGSRAKNRRLDRVASVVHDPSVIVRPDGTHQAINPPVKKTPATLIAGLRDVAGALNRQPQRTAREERENPTPLTEEETDFKRRQAAQHALARGGVYVGAGE